MGAALNAAAAMGAYAVSDRGTWIAFTSDLELMVEGERRLFNQYGVILVNPVKHPSVKKYWAKPSSTGCYRPICYWRLSNRRSATVFPKRQRNSAHRPRHLA